MSLRRTSRLSILLVAGLLALLPALLLGGIARPGQAAPAAQQQGDKLVLAFYYGWYGPDDFGRGQMSDRPAQPYNSNDPAVVERQVREARDAGLDAFISS